MLYVYNFDILFLEFYVKVLIILHFICTQLFKRQQCNISTSFINIYFSPPVRDRLYILTIVLTKSSHAWSRRSPRPSPFLSLSVRQETLASNPWCVDVNMQWGNTDRRWGKINGPTLGLLSLKQPLVVLRAMNSLQWPNACVFTPGYADEEQPPLLVFAQPPGSTLQC